MKALLDDHEPRTSSKTAQKCPRQLSQTLNNKSPVPGHPSFPPPPPRPRVRALAASVSQTFRGGCLIWGCPQKGESAPLDVWGVFSRSSSAERGDAGWPAEFQRQGEACRFSDVSRQNRAQLKPFASPTLCVAVASSQKLPIYKEASWHVSVASFFRFTAHLISPSKQLENTMK